MELSESENETKKSLKVSIEIPRIHNEFKHCISCLTVASSYHSYDLHHLAERFCKPHHMSLWEPEGHNNAEEDMRIMEHHGDNILFQRSQKPNLLSTLTSDA